MQARYKIGLTAAAFVLFFTICYRVLDTPFWNANAARLMPSFALAHHLNYYVVQPPGGPLYSSLYGPLVALVYLPATLFPSPNSAVLMGSVITVLLCFPAAAFLHFSPRKTGYGAIDGVAFLAAGLLMCYLEPLKYSCFNVHADGPGLALGAIACGALYPGGLWKERLSLPMSALCAVLSVLCKQMFVPLPFVLLAYLLAVSGWARALRYLAWLAAVTALCGGALILGVGAGRLYHCLIWVPAHHPWSDASRLVSLITAARFFIRLAMPVPVLLLACFVCLWTSGGLRRENWRELLRNRCVPVLLVGIALMPFSFAGRAKAGGDINSLSFATFFLACGLTVMLADIARGAASGQIRAAAVSVLAAIIIPLAISEAPLVLNIRAKVRQLPETGQQIALDYLRQHPGGAYFPWYPLTHYYAEHQFRHYIFGIVDRVLAGEAVSQAAFRAYIPRDPKVIAFAKDGTPDLFGYDVMNDLPEYRCQVTDPALPGWLVYSKCAQGALAVPDRSLAIR